MGGMKGMPPPPPHYPVKGHGGGTTQSKSGMTNAYVAAGGGNGSLSPAPGAGTVGGIGMGGGTSTQAGAAPPPIQPGTPDLDGFHTPERRTAGREFLAAALEISLERTTRFEPYTKWLVNVFRNPIARDLVILKLADADAWETAICGDLKRESYQILRHLFKAAEPGSNKQLSEAIYRLISNPHYFGLDTEELYALAMVLLTQGG